MPISTLPHRLVCFTKKQTCGGCSQTQAAIQADMYVLLLFPHNERDPFTWTRRHHTAANSIQMRNSVRDGQAIRLRKLQQTHTHLLTDADRPLYVLALHHGQYPCHSYDCRQHRCRRRRRRRRRCCCCCCENIFSC